MSDIERLKEIILMAYTLKWVYPPNETSYPLMQLSEVEKCMLAMVDDFELNRMRKWVEETQSCKESMIKLEDQDIFDLDHARWYKIIRNKRWPFRDRLVIEEQVYTNLRRFPVGNHLYYSECDGLHYRERGPPPIPPGPSTHSLRKTAKGEK